jgi:hypothetical protein
MPERNTAGHADPTGDHTASTSDSAAGQRRRARYVELVHTGMRVPHNRLGAGTLATASTHNGIALHAELLLDGAPVATIVKDGNGGGTELYSANGLFGWERMRDYAAACRLHGQPVDTETVLDRLIDEHQQAELVARVAAGHTAIRLLDHDRDLIHAFTIDHWIGPIAAILPRMVAEHLQREHGHPAGRLWQWWDGQRWRPLDVNGAVQAA